MFDVFIIGAGPGGIECAKRLALAGLKVAIADGQLWGGTCLNKGCIPLKYYLHQAKILYSFGRGMFGDGIITDNLNVTGLYAEKEKILAQMRMAACGELRQLDITLYEKNVQIARHDSGKIEVVVGDEIVACRKLVIATGSKSKTLEKPHNISYRIINSDDFFEMKEFPQSNLIIGAGVVGIELASFLRMIGKDVTILEVDEKIGGGLDGEIAEKMRRNLERQGVKIAVNVEEIRFRYHSVEYVVDGNVIEVCAENVIEAVGREPRIEALNLANIGIYYDKTGINIDERCRTNLENVYACGDVTGKRMLAHVAYKQAEIITNDILEKETDGDSAVIPTIIYSNPEVASIGYTEEACRKKGIAYEKRIMSMLQNGRYYVENAKDNCIIKMITDKESQRILGIHLMGSYASEIALVCEVFVANKMGIADVKKLIYPHPTVGEAIKQVAELF